MIPFAVEYLLTLKDNSGSPIVYTEQYQVIIPNFPPLTTLVYTVLPAAPVYRLIMYGFNFGQAMVPHSFDVKINHRGNLLFDAIVSGRYMTEDYSVFSTIGTGNPVQVTVTNLRLLVNYYELTTFCLSISNVDYYEMVVDALRRMQTSTESERLLGAISQKPPYGPQLPIGGE